MPEGDSLHRAARRLQVLVGERVEVETPHPRAAVKGLAARLDGRRLEQVEAVGKNLLLHFDGGLVLRSHLRLNGRWRVERRGTTRAGRPWLVLRGAEYEAVLWNGSVLELLGARGAPRLGPDILGEPPGLPDHARAAARTPQEREVGDALLDQRLVAGIGNLWRAEALWEAASRRGGRSASWTTTSCSACSRSRTGGCEPRSTGRDHSGTSTGARAAPAAVRSRRSLGAAGRARAHRTGARSAKSRRRAVAVVGEPDALAAPSRHAPPVLPRRLRRLHAELEDGVNLPFAFEEHGTYGRPTLYEYRPLVRGFVEARTERLFSRVDVQDAVSDLLREPAARIFARRA